MLKITLKNTAKKPLTHVWDWRCFWVNCGPVLKDLGELCEALKTMSKETFAHHVAGERNDFAKWIEEVLGDGELAKKLQTCKTSKKTCDTIQQWVKKQYAG